MPKSSPRRPNAAPCENLANAILVNGESSLRFVELLNSVYSEFRPATPSERALPEKLGVYQWLLLRALTLESAAISLEMNRRAESQTGGGCERGLTDDLYYEGFADRLMNFKTNFE